MEEKKGKIVKFSQLMKNGAQETYIPEGSSDVLYKQTIEFDNGDIGTSLTKTPIAPYKVDIEYTYIKKSSKNYTNFTKIKEVRVNTFQKSNYNDPSKIQKASYSVCLSAATDIAIIVFKDKVLNSHIIHLGQLLHNWVISTKVHTRDEYSLRWNSVLRTVNLFNILITDHVIYSYLEATIPTAAIAETIIKMANDTQNLIDKLEIENNG